MFFSLNEEISKGRKWGRFFKQFFKILEDNLALSDVDGIVSDDDEGQLAVALEKVARAFTETNEFQISENFQSIVVAVNKNMKNLESCCQKGKAKMPTDESRSGNNSAKGCCSSKNTETPAAGSCCSKSN